MFQRRITAIRTLGIQIQTRADLERLPASAILVHSAIHCTYNHIMQRFAAYAVASLFLWIMVIRLALAALAAA